MRNDITDAAFAHVTEINGVEYKLLRHHDITTVKDGKDHDSVDVGMLKFCCRLVDQIPVSDNEREQVMVHLYDHVTALDMELTWDEETKRKIANLSNPSEADDPITNEALDDRDGAMPDDNLGSSPSLPKGKEPNLDRPKDTRAGKVVTDENKDVGSSLPEEAPEGKVSVSPAPDDKSLQVHVDEEDKDPPPNAETLPGVVNDPGFQGNPDAIVKDEDKPAHKPETLIGSPVLVKVGNKVGVMLLDDFKNVTAKKSDNTVETYEAGEYLILAKLDVDPKEERNQCVIGDPSFLKEEDGRAAETDSMYVTRDEMTDSGKDTILDVLRHGFNGRVYCEYLGTEKHGQVDYVSVKVGDEEYPFHILLEVYRDADGNAVSIRLWNESLPADILSDFADFLKKLVKGKE